MSFFYGSMTHSYSGRKRKTSAYKTAPRKRVVFVPMEIAPSSRQQDIRDHYDKYPSYTGTVSNGTCGVSTETYKIEESKKFTIAPAYNKGAYQVIGKDNIKDIGR
jgi:hypothetical protein